MPETTYNYTISTQTANGAVANVELKNEIEASAIVTALKAGGIARSGDSLDITFKDAISAGDEVILTSVVAAHQGVAAVPVQVLVTKVHEQDLEPEHQVTGRFRGHGFEMDIPASTGDHILDLTFPVDISMLSMEYTPLSSMESDYFCVFAGYGTVAGTITSDVTASDTVISVSQTVIDNADYGLFVELSDGTNLDKLGQIIDWDTVANTITVETAAVNGFLTSTPTYVRLCEHTVQTVYLHGTARCELGHSKIGGSYFGKNKTLRIVYNNVTGTAKKFRATLEYLY